MTDQAHDDLSEQDYRRLAAFRHALRLFLRFSEQAARTEGITPNQHQLLLAVRGWPHSQAPTISEVARLLQLKVHSTGELARRAASAGLVAVESDPDDHRRQRITLKLRSLSMQHRDELRRFRLHLADLLDMLDDEPT